MAGAGSKGKAQSRMFASLAVRDFRFLWAGTLCTSFSMNIQMVARGYLVYEITHSATQLAWVTLAFMLPQVLFSLMGGALADRLPKKRLMIAGQSLNGIAALIMAVIILREQVLVWHFLVLGAFNGTLLALSMPARQSFIPEVVGERQLMNAIALNSASMNLSRILGPAAAGVLIALFHDAGQIPYQGVGLVYVLIGVLYLCSVISVLFVHLSGNSTRPNRNGVWQDIAEGVTYIRRSRVMLGLVVMGTFPLMFGMPMQNLLPAYSRSVLHGGPNDLGFLQAAMGIGAIVGTLTLARLGDFDHKGRLMFIGTFVWGVAIAAFTLSESLLPAMLLGAFAAVFSSSLMALNRTLMQLQAPAYLRGRIMSVDQMAHGLMPLGILPIGFLGDQIGVPGALQVSALTLVAITVVCFFLLPEVWRIRHGYPEPAATLTSNGQPQGQPPGQPPAVT